MDTSPLSKESAAGRSDDEAAQSRIRLAQKKKEREATRRAARYLQHTKTLLMASIFLMATQIGRFGGPILQGMLADAVKDLKAQGGNLDARNDDGDSFAFYQRCQERDAYMAEQLLSI